MVTVNIALDDKGSKVTEKSMEPLVRVLESIDLTGQSKDILRKMFEMFNLEKWFDNVTESKKSDTSHVSEDETDEKSGDKLDESKSDSSSSKSGDDDFE